MNYRSALALLALSSMSVATFAQATNPAPAAPRKPVIIESEDDKNLPASPDDNYDLRSTSISGTVKIAPIILTDPVNTKAGSLKSDSGLYWYPSVTMGYGYDSNLTEAAAGGEIGSQFLNISPQLIGEVKHAGDRYTFAINIDSNQYFKSSEDNFVNASLKAAGDLTFDARTKAAWAVSYIADNDGRGQNNRAVFTEVDKWHSTKLDGRFIYGAQEASGRFEVDLGTNNKVYDTNRAVTSLSDVNVVDYAGRFLVRLGTRTMALAEYRGTKYSYPDATSTQNNNERRIYAGLTWDVTSVTSGTLKLGNLTKNFDNATLTNFNGSSWEGALRWQPLTYSTFDFDTIKATQDSNGVGDYRLNTSYAANWAHKWSSVAATRVAYSFLNTEYGGLAVARTDKTGTTTLGFDYQLSRWLKASVDLSNIHVDSDVATSSFDRRVAVFSLTGTL